MVIFTMIIKKMTEVIGLKVFTNSGDYFGEVEDANVQSNKVDGWKIRVSGGMSSMISGARGVIIPHRFVTAINDVFIINRGALPGPESMPASSEVSVEPV
jgi:sporulation protein YlmC with PRC-barrel domain